MAIAKEKLEELIEQEAVIWRISDKKQVFFKRLDSEKSKIENNWLIWDYTLNLPFYDDELKDLYEHEHDAIHASKYVDMERVEKLSLPFWSEIQKSETYSYISTNTHCMSTDTENVSIYSLDAYGNSDELVFEKPLTQENYAEACEIIKKIWEVE